MSNEWKPEAEAPSGRWLMTRAGPSTRRYSEAGKEWEFVPTVAKKPAVKLGGDWWMWSDDHKTLQPYRVETGSSYPVNRGWPSFPVPSWADRPDMWCDIPEGVLSQHTRAEEVG